MQAPKISRLRCSWRGLQQRVRREAENGLSPTLRSKPASFSPSYPSDRTNALIANLDGVEEDGVGSRPSKSVNDGGPAGPGACPAAHSLASGSGLLASLGVAAQSAQQKSRGRSSKRQCALVWQVGGMWDRQTRLRSMDHNGDGPGTQKTGM